MARRANRKSLRLILPLSGTFGAETHKGEVDHVVAVSDSPQNDGDDDAWRILKVVEEDGQKVEYVATVYAAEDEDTEALRALRGGDIAELDIDTDEDGLIYVSSL